MTSSNAGKPLPDIPSSIYTSSWLTHGHHPLKESGLGCLPNAQESGGQQAIQDTPSSPEFAPQGLSPRPIRDDNFPRSAQITWRVPSPTSSDDGFILDSSINLDAYDPIIYAASVVSIVYSGRAKLVDIKPSRQKWRQESKGTASPLTLTHHEVKGICEGSTDVDEQSRDDPSLKHYPEHQENKGGRDITDKTLKRLRSSTGRPRVGSGDPSRQRTTRKEVWWQEKKGKEVRVPGLIEGREDEKKSNERGRKKRGKGNGKVVIKAVEELEARYAREKEESEETRRQLGE